VIVAVAAAKGTHGTTTLAAALAVVWPRAGALVLEADPSGADLPFRLRHGVTGRSLQPEPSVLTLATDARTGIPAGRLAEYSQPTGLGIRVIPGPMRTQETQALRGAWAAVAAEAARWDGTVIADLGRLDPSHDAVPVAEAATAVLFLVGADVAGLYRLRGRVSELAQLLGNPSRPRHPLTVVVSAPKRHTGQAVEQVTHLLASIGSPIPVIGSLPHDPTAAAALPAGQMTRRLRGSDLFSSARTIAGRLWATWPELAPAGPDPESSQPASVDLSRTPTGTESPAGTETAGTSPTGRPDAAPGAASGRPAGGRVGGAGE
jgi:hypothetical protein